MSKIIRILAGFLFVFALAQAANAATFTVTKTADTSDGICNEDCSLREAVAAANATLDDNVIEFASPLFDSFQLIVLSLGEMVITNNGSITINGPGIGPDADRLTIDGNNASRIFSINGAIVFINNLRFARGNGAGAANTGRGGAIYNNGGTATFTNLVITENTAASGGGTNHASTATTTYINCVISDNSATGAGGGMQNFSGSTLTMMNSTVSGNTSNSTLTGGGAIQANGTLSFTNTTFSGNTAAGGDGGALYYNGQGLTMNNVTIVGNNATGGGSGGLHKSTSTLNANIRNTVIAENTGSASPDAAGVFNSQGHNLIGNVGTSSGWVMSDVQNMPALVSPLGFYGGFGMTHGLLSGSPAINGGDNCVVDASCTTGNPPVPVPNDQRGAARAGNVDIGAYEVSSNYRAVLPNGMPDQGYGQIIVPNIFGFNYFVSSGSLPPGLELAILAPSQSDVGITALLVILGAPTQAGTFDFSLTATNGTNSADINYRIVVGTSVPATIVGRVLTADGRPIRGANIYISPSSKGIPTFITRAGYSSSFGYFTIEGLSTGQSYKITATAKGYSFTPQIVAVDGDISDLEITAQPVKDLGKQK